MDSNSLFEVFEDTATPNKRVKPLEENEVSEDNDFMELNDIDDLPCIMIHTLETEKSCSHEVAVPPGMDYIPLKDPFLHKSLISKKCKEGTPKKTEIDGSFNNLNEVEESAKAEYIPAKEYLFTLDPFQREAIKVLENYQSILVAAHTSAGKTAIAEYAIAMSLRDKQRVIYTTPIKALSNQKYRELYEEFKDVGLMTGDITINPTASCLVMTTEILRSMLYKGSEVMREVGWVIFDEIHYMRDKERGVVWEETIILLPDKVHYVFLSATILNATQFAEWICYLHHQPCHVVYTEYRPTPLQHYVFPANGDCLYLVVDESGEFIEGNFSQAMASLKDGDNFNSRGNRKSGSGKSETDVTKLIKMVMERDLQPIIVFSFSRKDCEFHALQMAKMDFNTADEKALLEEVFNNAIDVLSDEDKKLPQIHHLLPILRKGIGIHHSGLLPIIKETIEILFAEGLIKALFATETFAMGLNMPARTVLFTSCRKFDGTNTRWISSGEYIQMSGRAGRRGIDERGIVIMMMDQRMGSDIGKNIIKGKPDPLNSAFHLTYNMVLNLLRVEGINPEYMLEKSFHQFQNYSVVPVLREKISDIDARLANLEVVGIEEAELSKFYNLRIKLEQLSQSLQTIVNRPVHILPFLQPGRMVKVKYKELEFDWGIVLNYHKRIKKNGNYSTLLGRDHKKSTNDLAEDDKIGENNIEETKENSVGKDRYEYVADVLMHITRLKPGQDTSTKYVKPAVNVFSNNNTHTNHIKPILPNSPNPPKSPSTTKSNNSKLSFSPASRPDNSSGNSKSTKTTASPSESSSSKFDYKGNERINQLDVELNEMEVVPVLLQCIDKISSIRVYYPNDLRSVESRQSVLLNVKEIKRRFASSNPTPRIKPTTKAKVDEEIKKEVPSPQLSSTPRTGTPKRPLEINSPGRTSMSPLVEHENGSRIKGAKRKLLTKQIVERHTDLQLFDGIPLLDPICDMRINDPELKTIVKKIEGLESKLYNHSMFNKPELERTYADYAKKIELTKERQETYEKLQKTMSLIKMEELKHRKRVLRRIGFTNQSDVIELKGRVACEISTGDELVLTELIFNGAFNDLTTDQIVALLSCFVFQEKASDMPKLETELAVPLKMIQDTARRIAKVSNECKLDVNEVDYVNRFKPNLMDVVFAWSKGAPFHEIIKMTDVFEGSIIRCMRRLEELLREMYHSAKAIGNVDLENKFAEGCTKIKRDIIFAASLYL